MGYRVGYDSAMYSVFLRRDGTLPMTGDLNMGGQDINNAVNITASGTTTSGILKSTGSATIGSTLTVAGATNLNGATTVSNNLTVTGNQQVNGTINSSVRVTGGDIYSNSETYTTNWFRTLGDGGIYFQKYGGGWNMGDTATINAYNGKNVQTTGGFYGGYVQSTGNMYAAGYLQVNGNITSSLQIISNGRLTTNEFFQINGVATAGAGGSSNGLITRDSNGGILYCYSGVWSKNLSGDISSNTFTLGFNGTVNLGAQKFCVFCQLYSEDKLSFLRKLKWPDHIIPASIQKICPPLQHQAALFKVLGLLVTDGKCAETMSTNVLTGIIAHLTQRFDGGVFTHRLVTA